MSTLMRFQKGADVLLFESGASYPSRRVRRNYQIVDRTAANTHQVEDLGLQDNTRYLDFELMSKEDHDALENWFTNIARGSKETFDFTDEVGDTGEVRIMSPEFDFRQTSFEVYAGQLILEYV